MRLHIFTILALAATQAVAQDVDDTALAHNPFARPNTTVTSSSSGEDTGGWPEELRATLVDGAYSLANLDGTLVAVGEAIDGATVTHIGEGVVTLARGDLSRTMQLKDETPPTTRRSRRE